MENVYTTIRKNFNLLEDDDVDICLRLRQDGEPLTDEQVIEQANAVAAEDAENAPLTLHWELSASVKFSGMTQEQGLDLLGLGPFSSLEKSLPTDSLLKDALMPQLPEDVQGLLPDMDALVRHATLEMSLRRRLSGRKWSGPEVDRRTLISPILVCAATLVPDFMLFEQKELKGRKTHGIVDFVLDYQGFSILCVEAKVADNLEGYLGQLLGEIAAARDATRRVERKLLKRKADVLGSLEDALAEVPTYAILTNGLSWAAFKYTSKPLKLVSWERFDLDSLRNVGQTKVDQLQLEVTNAIQLVQAMLHSQKKDVDDYRVNKRPKIVGEADQVIGIKAADSLA